MGPLFEDGRDLGDKVEGIEKLLIEFVGNQRPQKHPERDRRFLEGVHRRHSYSNIYFKGFMDDY